MDAFFQDLRYGARMLIKNPNFTAVAVLTLALGIGANSAMFSVVNGLLLFALPFPESDRLIQIWASNQARGWNDASISYPNFLDWKKNNQTFEEMCLHFSTSLNMTGRGEPERIRGLRSSTNLFAVLQRSPAMGRIFMPEEDKPGADPVVIISHGLWQRRYGGDPGILGSTIPLDGLPHIIIGIMPADFWFNHPNTEVWLPHVLTAEGSPRGSRSYTALGRLKEGVELSQARADMDTIASQLEQEYPDENKGWGIALLSLRRQIADDEMVLMVTTIYLAALFVLLIACANVANLLLARAASREKEIALRMVMGGGRWRLLRQMLTESVLLATLAGISGLLVGYWFIKALLLIAPTDVPNLDKIRMDETVLIYTVITSLMTGFIFGLVPALQSVRPRIHAALKEGGRSHSGGSRHRLLKSLVVVEVALALVLLVCGGLMVRSFMARALGDPGFDTGNLLTARISLPNSKYEKPPQREQFYREVVAGVQGLPGVKSAAAVQSLPLDGNNWWSGITIEGRPPAQPGDRISVGYMIITPDYFGTLGIPLLLGRFFTDQDGTAHPVAIINETTARRHWPEEPNPVGRRLKFGSEDSESPWLPVVGVVGDVRHSDPGSRPRPEVYVPHSQESNSVMTIVARTATDPLDLAGPMRDAVWAVDVNQPVYRIRNMEQVVDERVKGPKAAAQVMGAVSILALVLAAVGIYGVVGYGVSQRTNEIGIRMALGARRGSIFRMILAQGMLLVGMGLIIGLVAAFFSMRVLDSVLHGITPSDPATYVTISFVLLMVALIASFLPARRATEVDPLIALRYE